ncbi:MAG: signal peptidase I, partial [Oscillospiraceae bacterium]|nr:signal peptidase I [Oscillospiraceae bacterium]
MKEFEKENLPVEEEVVEKIEGRESYEWLRSLVTAVLVVTLVFTFVLRLMGVSGASMLPTLQDGDRLL